MAAIKKRANDKVEASGKYKCEPCDRPFRDQHALTDHIATEKHRNKVAGITKQRKKPRDKARQLQNLAEKRYYCSTCKFNGLQQQALTNHLNTPRHRERVAAAAAKANSG